MDKMREEFEKWFKHDYHPDKTGPYMKNALLCAWQASRAALCVNLPTNETTWPDGTELVDRERVEKSMDVAGVRYS